MPKLSLTMIVKNEEKFLPGCLDSVRGIADEIVLVDTGSTDQTIEIAKKYNAKVYYYEWVNDFSSARNFALSKAEGDWILYLDADERLTEQSIRQIEKIKSSDKTAGYFCTVKSIDNENSRDNSMRYIRLFKNVPGLKFSGTVHEQISPSLKELNVPLYNSQITIEHLGYNISIEEKSKKATRNLSLLLEEYTKNSSGYNAFQLANTYNILDDIPNSEKYFKIALESKDITNALKAECYCSLALIAHKEFRYEEALKNVDLSINLNKEQPFAYLLASKIFLQSKNGIKASEYCRKSYDLNKKIMKGNSSGDIMIYLDNEEIICYGIQLAIQNNDKENLHFYFKEYEKYYQSKNTRISIKIQKILNKLLSKQSLNNEEEDVLLNLINRYSSDLLYMLIEHSLSVQSESFIERLFNLYKIQSSVLKIYSLYYFERNDIAKAIGVLEENAAVIEKDASVIIYLISYYITVKSFKNASKWLDLLEKDFGQIPQMAAVINKIKTQIY